MRNQFFALEGVDCSGKTTVGKKLAESISGKYMKTRGDGYEQARTHIDNGTPSEAKLLFYLSSVFDDSFKIRGLLENQSVVCDRYIWS